MVVKPVLVLLSAILSFSVSTNTKYILIWTVPYDVITDMLGYGASTFETRHCPVSNCFITIDRNHLGDVTKFDAILFHGMDLGGYGHRDMLPARRSPHQKYIFATAESAVIYPVCNGIYDNFFNWTFTYRLDSDIRLRYIVVRNKLTKRIIGPKMNMKWLSERSLRPISNNKIRRLNTKSKAAAWIVSNCYPYNHRDLLATRIDRQLRKNGFFLDIYGRCGTLKCEDDCNLVLEREYFFYLSFENSHAEDYVTEKVLLPLISNTVPIVYGGANYSRFLPPGSYLNANKNTPEEIANTIVEAIFDRKKYHNFFRWKSHYTFHDTIDSPKTDESCNLCAALHHTKMMNKKKSYKNFRRWWNPKNHDRCRSQFAFEYINPFFHAELISNQGFT